MIILSGVLVVLAIALLVTGIVTGNTGHEIAGLDGLKLIYVSIGVSIVSALFLAIGVFLRRKELFGSAASQTSSKKASTPAVKAGKAAKPTKAKARVGASDDTAPAVPLTSATATDVPADTAVYVVPGRKRYHLETCRQLAGRDKEELTFVEAREEGFTACTACLPDTALAARAALADTETEIAVSPAEAELPEADEAQITRTDLPIAISEPATAELEPASTPTEYADEPDETDLADLAEHTETAEPVTEEPATRSRSMFEPLHTDTPEHEEPSADPEDTETSTAEEEPELPADEEPEPVPADEDEADATATATERDEDHSDLAQDETDDEPEEPATEAAEPEEATDSAEAPAEPEGEPEESSSLSIVRILSGTKRYHRTDCALIEDIAEDADDLETVTPAEAKERGCTPCLVCQPDKEGADDF